jgi:hypothetical protein
MGWSALGGKFGFGTCAGASLAATWNRAIVSGTIGVASAVAGAGNALLFCVCLAIKNKTSNEVVMSNVEV